MSDEQPQPQQPVPQQPVPQQPVPQQPVPQQPVAQPQPPVPQPPVPQPPVAQPQQPVPQQPAAPTPKEPSGFVGLFNDPATLAATGLILAVLLSVSAGMINLLSEAAAGGLRARLTALTDTIDLGDVAVLGIAIVLLLLTPDPPGGVSRSLLMQADALLATVTAFFALLKSVLLLTGNGDSIFRLAQFITTTGVTLAAATVAFYAARESFRKEREDEAEATAA